MEFKKIFDLVNKIKIEKYTIKDEDPIAFLEKNIYLPPQVTPYPGLFLSRITPYFRGVLEQIRNNKGRKIIVLCWSAQSGKTTIELLSLLYLITHNAGNVLYVRPSIESARVFFEMRLLPIIEANKNNLNININKIKPNEIWYDNHAILLRGATPAQLSAETIKYLFFDECDKYPTYKTTSKEADAVSLALERTKFLYDAMIFMVSTPTTENATIWRWYEMGTKSHYYITCPFCLGKITLEIKNLVLHENSIFYQCYLCKNLIDERQKMTLLNEGMWIAEKENAEILSYHLNELYSPVSSWSLLYNKYKDALENASAGYYGILHNFVNSSLALPWDITEYLNQNREIMKSNTKLDIPKNTLPEDFEACAIVIGIDTQDNGFYYIIRAYAANSASILLDHGFIIDKKDLYDLIINYRANSMHIVAGLIDSGGHRTDEIYDFCMQLPHIRPCKGVQRMNAPFRISTLEHNAAGKPLPSGNVLVLVNTNFYKDMIVAKMHNNKFKVNRDATEEYFLHMSSEYKDEKGVWKQGKYRSDFWDCEVYALCCADILNITHINYYNQGKSQVENTKKNKHNPYLGRFLNPLAKGRV